MTAQGLAKHLPVCWWPRTFERFVEIGECARTSTGCLEWNRSRKGGEYGRVNWPGLSPRAHVMSFILTNGPLRAETPWVLHRCDNPPCIEPSHLYAGTVRENVADMIARNRQSGVQIMSFEQRSEMLKRVILQKQPCPRCGSMITKGAPPESSLQRVRTGRVSEMSIVTESSGFWSSDTGFAVYEAVGGNWCVCAISKKSSASNLWITPATLQDALKFLLANDAKYKVPSDFWPWALDRLKREVGV